MKSQISFSKPRKLRPFLIRRVVGLSMQPTLQAGQLVIGVTYKKPQPGQVVIVEYNDRELIKRLKKTNLGKLYILGDNQADSLDSRKLGWISGDSYLATVIWPLNRRPYPHFIPTLSQEK